MDSCQWDQFYEIQRKILSDFPETAVAYLAQAMSPGKNISERLALLNASIKLDPAFAKLYTYRGLVYRDLNANRQAIRDFSEGLALQPGNYILYIFRGKSYLAAGEYFASFKDLFSYFTSPLCDDSAPVLSEMMIVLSNLGQLEMAAGDSFRRHHGLWLDKISELSMEEN